MHLTRTCWHSKGYHNKIKNYMVLQAFRKNTSETTSRIISLKHSPTNETLPFVCLVITHYHSEGVDVWFSLQFGR